jgi:hypothetical protein
MKAVARLGATCVDSARVLCPSSLGRAAAPADVGARGACGGARMSAAGGGESSGSLGARQAWCGSGGCAGAACCSAATSVAPILGDRGEERERKGSKGACEKVGDCKESKQ